MADILTFRKKKSAENKGSVLCRRGFHKWEVLKENKFDTQHGKLVTIRKCKRCGKQKIEGT